MHGRNSVLTTERVIGKGKDSTGPLDRVVLQFLCNRLINVIWTRIRVRKCARAQANKAFTATWTERKMKLKQNRQMGNEITRE